MSVDSQLRAFAKSAGLEHMLPGYQKPAPTPSQFGCSFHPEQNRRNKARIRAERAKKAKRKAAARARMITRRAR